jgi:hypothetical protein
MEAAPDWAALEAALEASMGVRVRVVPASATIARVHAGSVAGGADVGFTGGVLEWEAPLNANPYFIEHLHQALVGLGATPCRKRTPRDDYRGVPWRALPLRQRLAHGLVGKSAFAVLWVLMTPLIVVGLVVANVLLMVRKLVRRMLGDDERR